nr:RNA binding protein EIF1AD [Hymenolepis microstoma]
MLSGFAKRKRALDSLFRDDISLSFGEFVCMLLKSQGNYLFTALTSSGEEIYVSIPEKFRNAYFFRAKSFVICSPLEMPKIRGEIVCMLNDDQVLTMARKPDWPTVFTNLPKGKYIDKGEPYVDPDLLPPSNSESEEEYDESEEDEEQSNSEPIERKCDQSI